MRSIEQRGGSTAPDAESTGAAASPGLLTVANQRDPTRPGEPIRREPAT